jgi:hypothetical protein
MGATKRRKPRKPRKPAASSTRQLVAATAAAAATVAVRKRKKEAKRKGKKKMARRQPTAWYDVDEEEDGGAAMARRARRTSAPPTRLAHVSATDTLDAVTRCGRANGGALDRVDALRAVMVSDQAQALFDASSAEEARDYMLRAGNAYLKASITGFRPHADGRLNFGAAAAARTRQHVGSVGGSVDCRGTDAVHFL